MLPVRRCSVRQQHGVAEPPPQADPACAPPAIVVGTHALIEELMILANEQVASYLADKKLPTLYRAVLETVDLDTVDTKGYGFQIEMTYRVVDLGARIVEVPIAFTDRVRGTSKMSGRMSGSPPESSSTGTPNAARSSRRATPCAVVSSPG